MHLVSEQLHTLGYVSDEDEVLDGSGVVDVDLCVNEGHTHQVLVVLEVPHEDLEGMHREEGGCGCVVCVCEGGRCGCVVYVRWRVYSGCVM